MCNNLIDLRFLLNQNKENTVDRVIMRLLNKFGFWTIKAIMLIFTASISLAAADLFNSDFKPNRITQEVWSNIPADPLAPFKILITSPTSSSTAIVNFGPVLAYENFRENDWRIAPC